MVSAGWKQIDGLWYYFGSDGVMASSKWIASGQNYCYVSSSGAMLTGWQDIGGQTYYLSKSTGYRVAGQWAKIDGKTYYFNKDGQLQRNTVIDGYKVDANGVWVP